MAQSISQCIVYTNNKNYAIITDMNTGTDTVQDMKFNDEAYKNCKGK